jgi:hypothetical protein
MSQSCVDVPRGRGPCEVTSDVVLLHVEHTWHVAERMDPVAMNLR